MEAISRRNVLVASTASSLLAAPTTAWAQQPAQAIPAPANAPDMNSLRDLIDAARITAPSLADLMSRHLPGLKLGGAAAVPVPVAAPTRDTTTVPTAASRDVVAVWGQDFLFTVASDRPAVVSIDLSRQCR